ncbi:MAG: fasciclin domain-containing protein [Breznakibacter sp.]
MNKKYLSMLAVFVCLAAACSDAWDDHVKINDNVSQQNITQYMASEDGFSKFWALVIQTQVDKKLDSTTIYTIWAPTNAAMDVLGVLNFESDADKMKFVLNHISFGKHSAFAPSSGDSIYMLSGKKLVYFPSMDLIDGVQIAKEQEMVVKNGVIQVVNSALVPRMTIWDWVMEKAPDNMFVRYVKSLNYYYFDPEASGYLGTDDKGNAIYRDSVVVLKNKFIQQVADMSSEDSLLTLLVPSDEAFVAEFNKFQKYYRVEDRSSNVIPTVKDSANIWINVAKDFLFRGVYSLADAPDTLVSFFNVKVPFIKGAVASSFSCSNGFVHMVSECPIKVGHKILPIIINAEQCLYSPSSSTIGSSGLYRRERKDAYMGYDVILDNHASSGILSGLVLVGPKVCSIKYRVKIRAINDFEKSTYWPDAGVALRQMVGTVTVIRNKTTDLLEGVSSSTNYLNSSSTYGQADVTYDPNDLSTYYVPVTHKAYSPIELAISDEVDLGYYEYRYMENAFFRIIPYESRMAVTLDYIRLVPIIE